MTITTYITIDQARQHAEEAIAAKGGWVSALWIHDVTLSDGTRGWLTLKTGSASAITSKLPVAEVHSSLDYMAERKAAHAAREAAIEDGGIQILRAAIAKRQAARERVDAAIARGSWSAPSAQPLEDEVERLEAAYPASALYLRAEGWAGSRWTDKAAAGRDAMAALLDGVSAEQVEAQMAAATDTSEQWI